MKIGLYADPHFSQNSGVLVGREGIYTKRLSNLVKSFKWMNKFFKEQGCSEIVCLGDLTDRPDLTAEEITALSECGIEDHTLIVGNHCRSDKSGEVSTLSLFKKSFFSPTVWEIGCSRILILPYNSTVSDLNSFGKVDIILSHNDLKGYDFGNHISTEGYDIQDILDNCQLFVNGHLHNGGWLIENRIVNLGQLTGINFSSCGGQWEPSVGIYDTETKTLTIHENPEALRFKKVEKSTLTSLKNYIESLSDNPHVVQVKVPEKISSSARKLLNQYDKVVASRILVVKDKKKSTTQINKKSTEESTTVYDKLRKFISDQNPEKFDHDKVFKIVDDLEKKEGVE